MSWTFHPSGQEVPNTSRDQDKVIDKLIDDVGEEIVARALKLDLQDSPFFTGKDGQRTRYPLTRFVGRAYRLVRQIKIQNESQDTKLTAGKIARINEVQNLQHEQLWAVLDKACRRKTVTG